jgi:hypothetical protein
MMSVMKRRIMKRRLGTVLMDGAGCVPRWLTRWAPCLLPVGCLTLLGSAAIAPAAQAGWQEVRPENERAMIRFINDTPRSLYVIQVSPRYEENWRDVLGRSVLKGGDLIEAEFDYSDLVANGCEYRVQAIYSNGQSAVLEGQFYNLCDLRQIQFGPIASANPYNAADPANRTTRFFQPNTANPLPASSPFYYPSVPVAAPSAPNPNLNPDYYLNPYYQPTGTGEYVTPSVYNPSAPVTPAMPFSPGGYYIPGRAVP